MKPTINNLPEFYLKAAIQIQAAADSLKRSAERMRKCSKEMMDKTKPSN
ncbi:hypothetical protein Phi2_0005 [Vibrio phage phi 2]|nr:hypothetical protein SBVcX29_0066 [Vibrio phage X29]AHN84814.1 hypothetical protein Phi2_0005 [Vibrio phage phi 2]AIA10345.1 hypothetical protein SBVcX29_0066 [Vibrio phage X29]